MNKVYFTNVFSPCYKKIATKLFSDAVEKNYSSNKNFFANVKFVSEEEIQKLNNEFRNINRVTDVLSFPGVDYENPSDFSLVREDESAYLNPDTEELVLGDIVICAARVFSQAEEYGHTPLREFAFLVTHSMLHLLGYDHMEPEEEKAMFARQEEILKELGITR